MPAGRILRILLVVVCGGQFPVNPLTITYISQQIAAGQLQPHGPIRPLALLDLEELEGCQALHRRRGMTLPQLLGAWRQSLYSGVAFRNYLAYEYGGQEHRRRRAPRAGRGRPGRTRPGPDRRLLRPTPNASSASHQPRRNCQADPGSTQPMTRRPALR